MPRLHYECSDFECKFDGVTQDASAPRPMKCMCGEALTADPGRPVNDDEDDDVFPSPTQSNSPRPAWNPHRRAELKDRNRRQDGKLYCSLCGDEIVVNQRGKEVWTSKSGKTHETSPHVDHFGSRPIPTTVTGGVGGVKGDWIDRKRAMRNDPNHMAKPKAVRKKIERDVYNASPLRTTHMTCNCSRPKSRPGPY